MNIKLLKQNNVKILKQINVKIKKIINIKMTAQMQVRHTVLLKVMKLMKTVNSGEMNMNIKMLMKVKLRFFHLF